MHLQAIEKALNDYHCVAVMSFDGAMEIKEGPRLSKARRELVSRLLGRQRTASVSDQVTAFAVNRDHYSPTHTSGAGEKADSETFGGVFCDPAPRKIRVRKVDSLKRKR